MTDGKPIGKVTDGKPIKLEDDFEELAEHERWSEWITWEYYLKYIQQTRR